MKLYATTRGGRKIEGEQKQIVKGQGGEFLEITILDEDKKVLATINANIINGFNNIVYANKNGETGTIYFGEKTKGKRQKGEKI